MRQSILLRPPARMGGGIRKTGGLGPVDREGENLVAEGSGDKTRLLTDVLA